MARVFVLNRNVSLIKAANIFGGSAQKATFVTLSNVDGKRKLLYASLGVAAATGLSVLYALERSVKAADLYCHPVAMDWPHSGFMKGMDIRSVRRGYQVYKQVCAACHTINFYKYRHFVDKFMTDQEARDEAAQVMVEDGPNDEGKMFTRPGKLNDLLPRPYPNDIAAKIANNQALPPDLALIALGRHGNEDYIFSLLTGYQEAPAGVVVGDGQAYNPYFAGGGVLSMAQQLFDDMLEYDDGTPATQSQMAKDVSTFLKYLSEPEWDDRKKWFFKLLIFTVPVTILTVYFKRFYWSSMKHQKISFYTVKGREPPKSSS